VGVVGRVYFYVSLEGAPVCLRSGDHRTDIFEFDHEFALFEAWAGSGPSFHTIKPCIEIFSGKKVMKNTLPERLPLARTEQLIVKEVDGEVLVYDLQNNQAHCLNKTAAEVWKNCDGLKSITDISIAVGEELNSPFDERLVRLALDQLKKFDLLESAAAEQPFWTGINRRKLMKTIGVSALALPVIVSIVSPTAVSAASCNQPTGRDPGCPCTSDAQCTSVNCHGGAGNQKC
jgi:hypothetical protein